MTNHTITMVCLEAKRSVHGPLPSLGYLGFTSVPQSTEWEPDSTRYESESNTPSHTPIPAQIAAAQNHGLARSARRLSAQARISLLDSSRWAKHQWSKVTPSSPIASRSQYFWLHVTPRRSHFAHNHSPSRGRFTHETHRFSGSPPYDSNFARCFRHHGSNSLPLGPIASRLHPSFSQTTPWVSQNEHNHSPVRGRSSQPIQASCITL